MKKNLKNGGLPTQSGFIKMILIVIAALVLLKYIYDIDVVGYLTTGKFKDWLDKLYKMANQGWDGYKDAFLKAWDYFINISKKFLADVKPK
jgi:hypothetical protein